MVTVERTQAILAKLGELARRDSVLAVFGAAPPHGHGYRTAPTLSAHELGELEASFRVALPQELQAFLAEVHGGGAGPGYGFSVHADERALPRRREVFPFTQADAAALISRRLAGGEGRWASMEMPDDAREDDGVDDDDDWPPGPGFVPIAHHGCGAFDVIVTVGELRGFVWWCDMTWGPYFDDDGRPLGFFDWYEAWLDDGCRRVHKE